MAELPAVTLDWMHRTLSSVENHLTKASQNPRLTKHQRHNAGSNAGRVSKVLDYLETVQPELAEADE